MNKMLKNACKVELQVWQFTSKHVLLVHLSTAAPKNKRLLLIKLKSCSFDVWFVLMFKIIKIF